MAITYKIVEADVEARSILVSWCDGKITLNHRLPDDLTEVLTEEGLREHVLKQAPPELFREPLDPAVEQQAAAVVESMVGRTFVWRDPMENQET